MNQLLKPQMEIQTESGMACRVEAFLGGGGQGEVYRGVISEKPVAVKWYFQEQATDAQRTALIDLIQRGAPNDKFLWPISLMANSAAWIYASRMEKTPSRRHIVEGRNHFAFSDVRKSVAQAAADSNFGILSPVPRKSVLNSLVEVLLRMAA